MLQKHIQKVLLRIISPRVKIPAFSLRSPMNYSRQVLSSERGGNGFFVRMALMVAALSIIVFAAAINLFLQLSIKLFCLLEYLYVHNKCRASVLE
jgi:hypothetical protein